MSTGTESSFLMVAMSGVARVEVEEAGDSGGVFLWWREDMGAVTESGRW